MIGRILLAISVFTVTFPAQALWEVGGGAEHFQWIEYPAGYGSPKESGTRYALFGNWTQEGDQGVLLAWRAKVYTGTVNYDTFLIGSGAPVSTKTDYLGAVSEGQMFYRYELGTSAYRLDQLGGLGLDFWRRHIRSGVEQIEDYSILYLRAGLRLTKSRLEAGFHGEWGIKYPIATNENAHLTSMGYTTNPSISPKGDFSGYAEVGYRINAKFDVLGYYDSWRFKRSDDVVTTDSAGATWLIHQPKSEMDAWGVKLLVSF